MNKFEFLEKYFPNYYHSNEIATLNDLASFLDNEITYEILKERQPWIDGLYPENIKREFDTLMAKALDECELFEVNQQ